MARVDRRQPSSPRPGPRRTGHAHALRGILKHAIGCRSGTRSRGRAGGPEDPLAAPPPGRRGGVRSGALDDVSPPGMGISGLGRPDTVVLAGHRPRCADSDLPGRLGRRAGLLDPGRALAPPDRPGGLDRLGRPRRRVLALVAALPRAGPVGPLPPGRPAHPGRADLLGDRRVPAGLFPHGVPLVLPGPQSVPLPLRHPDRRRYRIAGRQPADRDGQRLAGRAGDDPLAPPRRGPAPIDAGAVGPPLDHDDPGRDHPLLRRLPGLDGPVPPRAAGRAVAVEPRAGPQVQARPVQGARGSSISSAGRRAASRDPT